MRVVIAGAGLVGRGLARRLLADRHDVSVVEANRETCERVYAQIGATMIHGSATSIQVLEEAELARADCAAGVMRNDADNLCFALLAKNMGVERTIVRMRDPAYEDVYRMAGVSQVLNIVDLYLNQFVWEIEDPHMREVTSFCKGRASIVFVKVSERSHAAGRTVAAIAQHSSFPDDCVVAGIVRAESDDFIIPRGDVRVAVGDRVYLAAGNENIHKAVKFLGGR
jgi:trk/ktr system potassium uptake protein